MSRSLDPWTLLAVLSAALGCTQLATQPPLVAGEPCHLAFKARVIDSTPAQLPAGIRSVLEESAVLGVRYREEVAHAHWEVPTGAVLVLSPVFLLGAPMGEYRVSVHGALDASDAQGELARYEAVSEVSRKYGLVYGSTFHELEQEARDGARRVIDQEVCNDSRRLAENAGTRTHPSEEEP